MRYSVLTLAVTLSLLMFSSISFALPRFALMVGAKCGSCHVNPTGGQMRTEYGVAFSADKLPLESSKDEDFSFSGKLNDNISIGGDYRGQFFYDDASKTSTFQAMNLGLYGVVTLSKNVMFYFKQDVINGTYGGWLGGIYGGTEAFGMVKPFSNSWYVKGGVFLPNYGWRLDDHTAYTRGGDLGFFAGSGYHPGLIFIPNYKDIGLEIGGYVDNLFITAGLFNGTGHREPLNPSKEKAYVGKVEYMGTMSSVNYRVGVSGYGMLSYKMWGTNIGIATEDIALLAEIDWTHNQLNPFYDPYGPPGPPQLFTHVRSMAAYSELDWRMMQGLWLTGKYDMFDPQQGIKDDAVKRVSFGCEMFPYSFVELRPQYRLILGAAGAPNNGQVLIQTHVWF